MPWAAIIPAVIGAVGSYIASKKAAKAGKPSGTEKQLQQSMLDTLGQAKPYGLDFLNTAKHDLGAASDFSNSVMNGGWQNMLGLLGPELGANARANQGAFASSLRLNPRASGTGSERLGLMDSAQSSRNNALLSLRPTAATMLASLGGQAGGLGSGLLGLQSSGSLGLLGQGLQNRMGAFDMSRQAMQGISSIMSGMNWGGGAGQQQQQLPQSQTPAWLKGDTLKPGTGG